MHESMNSQVLQFKQFKLALAAGVTEVQLQQGDVVCKSDAIRGNGRGSRTGSPSRFEVMGGLLPQL